MFGEGVRFLGADPVPHQIAVWLRANGLIVGENTFNNQIDNFCSYIAALIMKTIHKKGSTVDAATGKEVQSVHPPPKIQHPRQTLTATKVEYSVATLATRFGCFMTRFEICSA